MKTYVRYAIKGLITLLLLLVLATIPKTYLGTDKDWVVQFWTAIFLADVILIWFVLTSSLVDRVLATLLGEDLND